jgi:hypothetical protein
MSEKSYTLGSETAFWNKKNQNIGDTQSIAIIKNYGSTLFFLFLRCNCTTNHSITSVSYTLTVI